MMNSMQSAGSLHYSTVGVTESRRFEYWNDVVLRHCIPAASAPLAGVDFDARLTDTWSGSGGYVFTVRAATQLGSHGTLFAPGPRRRSVVGVYAGWIRSA